jgi:predicted nuclease of restriction endonuclease-like (RecB) superfamily
MKSRKGSTQESDENPLVSVNTALLPTATETISRIREILTKARHQALQTVDAIALRANWEIGREIVEEEQRGKGRAEYGAHLIVALSKNLTAEFGAGYKERNLAYMRQLYQVYPNLHALRAELSWTHYRLLLRVNTPEARAFYETEAVRAHWSTRELERQIHSSLYERYALSRDKEGVLRLASQGAEATIPEDILRDPFILEFTGLKHTDNFDEKTLEDAILDRLQDFLLELGTDFCFVGRQKRHLVEDEWYKVDLVFYHRLLRCFVLIDLKMGKITPQDVGQMLSYVGYYEQEETREGEGPPIGILLGADKNETAIRYTLTGNAQKVFAARYQLHLPSEDDLRKQVNHIREDFLLEQHLDEDSANE